MRILALDHGGARVGVAICDPTETLVRPIGVISPPDAAAVGAMAAEHEVGLVVVGLPISLGGEEGEQADHARAFAAEVAAAVTVAVETYDERLTTRLAEASARAGAAAPPDALAAAHLLESYLQHRAGPAREGSGTT